jgi:ABC-type glycerol-3-phosphate transport system substrate-binding protein
MALSDRIKPTARDTSATFERGKVGMYYSWTWYKPILQKNVGNKMQWSVMPIPTLSGSPTAIRGRNNYESGYAVPGNLKATKKAEAFKFLKWLYSDDNY